MPTLFKVLANLAETAKLARLFLYRSELSVANEDGDMRLVNTGSDGLSAIVVLPRSVVGPTALVLGQVSIPLGDSRLRDRTNQILWTEHILVFLLERFRIVGKIKDERTHQRVSLFGNHCGARINIRTKHLALLQTVGNDFLRLLTIVPGLGIAHIAMDAHERQIDAGLNPTQHPLDIFLVIILVGRTEETTGIVASTQGFSTKTLLSIRFQL